MEELTCLSATELAGLIKKREVSPVELAKAYLRRIEQLNPSLNAIVTLAPNFSEQAGQAEAAVMRGEPLGPLHGVPVTVKDTIETAGLLTTSGSPARSKFVPERDAPAVARLKAAGAIILAKTSPAEMAMDYTGENPLFPTTNNPYDQTRTSGGSSAGEAAAIAACMSPAGLGSDLAGSVRIPSHFCGIVGLKPGTGRIPGEGQFPPSAGPYSLGAVIGPMARRVVDLRLLFAILAKGEFQRVHRSPVNLGTSQEPDLRGRQCAWYADDGVAPVTKETHNAVKAAAQALGGAGLMMEERRPPGVERGHDLWLKVFSRTSVVQLRDVYRGYEEQAGPFVRWRLATADDHPIATLDEYITAWIERDRLRSDLIRWMDDVPLLLAPVGATPAFAHNDDKVTVGNQTMSTFRAFSYSQTFNVFDLPSVCVRAGTSSEGLPIGVQIVGRPGAEEEVLTAAEIVESTLGGWRPPDPQITPIRSI